MANLTPAPGWDNVPQIETADLVMGGAGGTANQQAQALLNRLEFIYPLLQPARLFFLSGD